MKKETILELILMERALSTREKAEALAKAKRLLPGVATLEAGLAAYILGVIQRHTGNDDGKGQGSGPILVAGLLEVFGLLAADRSALALHADAVATGLLSACAYRAGLASRDPSKK